MSPLSRFVIAGSIVMLSSAAHGADKSSGTIACDGNEFAAKYAWLVRAPNVTWQLVNRKDDLYDPKTPTMLRLYFSDQDKSEAIKACVNLSCITDALENYLYVDVGDPKDVKELMYQVKIPEANGRCNSGDDRTVLKLTTQAPDHLAGKLEKKKMVGDYESERWDVDFDLTLFKTVKTEYQFE